ncbi:MAG: Na+/glutamate symporter [Firmicutes bacterium]|nr:Na+/glutamate symporter [Bacillota bacterium]
MDYNAYSLLIDFAFASAFILFGQLLRAKVKFFQRFFVPASLIAGILGFVVGPGIFKIIPFSSKISSYSGLLIILVFVAMGIRGFNISTKGWKEDVERLGSYTCFREFSYMLQYTLPIVFGYYVLREFFPDLHPGFGMIFGAGWAGGPGTSAAIGSTFAKYGFADAVDLGMTSATLGILTAVFGGIILIKWATKKGITRYIADFESLPQELRTGLVPEEKREEMGKQTISLISLDSLAWHLALILLPAGIARLVSVYCSDTLHLEVPSFSIAFMLALIFSFCLRGAGAKKYIDNKIISRISGCATDYLIFFGMTSIKLAIVIKYAVPLGLLMLFGLVLVVGSFLYLAPRMNKKDWFERTIFCFGYLTGVYANSFMLTRIVDPDMKSKTLEDIALLDSGFTVTDILVISLGPILLSSGNIWSFLTPAFAYLIFFAVLAKVMKWWWPNLPLNRKDMIL